MPDVRIFNGRKCWLVIGLLTSEILAWSQEPPRAPSVFDQPALQMMQANAGREIAALFAAKDFSGAEKKLRELIARQPTDSNSHYNLACALARLGKPDEAIAALDQAVKLGFRDRRHIEADEDLAGLRDDKRFREILTAAEKPPATRAANLIGPSKLNEPADGQVLVEESNTMWNPQIMMFNIFFRLDKAGLDKDGKELPIASGLGSAGDLLREWQKEGTAAGNRGDLYDNHDSDHSNMNFAAFPQLTRIEYSDAAKQRQLHHGLQRWLLFHAMVPKDAATARAGEPTNEAPPEPQEPPAAAVDAVKFTMATTIGNSSTAMTAGPFWRCQGRNALTQPGGANLLAMQYQLNHLYFYPEHRDHDPGHNGAGSQGHGDVFPANTPYLILSQGSSGSDIAFMNAVAATLAAFRPEVKRDLAANGLLMPAVQMIFRMSNKQVAAPEDYLKGAAHPTVFDAEQLDVDKMVRMAHDMKTESLPPLCQIKVVEEDEAVVGRDYFDLGPRERLLDTPFAIARVVKSSKYERRMVVSAEPSRDRHGKPLKFHWVVLRGDESRISIKPQNDAGSIAELRIGYHERRPILPGSPLESNRVDIGVFAHNGDYFSAPAFVSLFYLDNEKREYDDQHRIRAIDYTAADVKDNYVDPLVDLKKDWRDEYRYADDGDMPSGGKLLGWTRIRGERREEFTAEGRVVTAVDDAGKPTATAAVRYVAVPVANSAPVLEQIVEGPPAP